MYGPIPQVVVNSEQLQKNEVGLIPINRKYVPSFNYHLPYTPDQLKSITLSQPTQDWQGLADFQYDLWKKCIEYTHFYEEKTPFEDDIIHPEHVVQFQNITGINQNDIKQWGLNVTLAILSTIFEWQNDQDSRVMYIQRKVVLVATNGFNKNDNLPYEYQYSNPNLREQLPGIRTLKYVKFKDIPDCYEIHRMSDKSNNVQLGALFVEYSKLIRTMYLIKSAHYHRKTMNESLQLAIQSIPQSFTQRQLLESYNPATWGELLTWKYLSHDDDSKQREEHE
jgi:hypothetical protein